MPYGKLVGTDTIGTDPCSGGNHRLTKFVATDSGAVDEFRVYSLSNGFVKVNIYETNEAGEPGDLVWAQDSSQSVTGPGWNTIAVPDVAVVTGTTYWLGANGNAGGRVSFSGDASTTRLKSSSYPSFNAPDPAGISFTDINDEQGAFSLYGLPDPGVTSVNGDDTFFDHDTGIDAVGTDFGASQGTGKLELANNADYDSATIITEQTINTWADTTINFDVKSGALGDGAVYAFVTTDAGQRNLVGHSATLTVEVSQGSTGGEGLPVPNGFWPYNGVWSGVTKYGIIKHGIRTAMGAANFKALDQVPGIDNIDPIIDFPVSSGVAPAVRYKGDDADATNFDPWTYGNILTYQSGTPPTFNNGSPLWQSSNDDSVCYNSGGYHRDSSNFTAISFANDFYLEGLVYIPSRTSGAKVLMATRTASSGGIQFQRAAGGSAGGFVLFMQDDLAASKTISSGIAAEGWIFFSFIYDASENSINNSMFIVNGVNGTATNAYGLGDVTHDKLTFGARADGSSPADGCIAYVTIYNSSTLWSGGSDNLVDPLALHKERLYKIAGVYPSLFDDDTIAFTRGHTAYLQNPSDIASATDLTKRLWYMGDHWPRVSSTVDSNEDTSTGYLSEPQKANLSDQWQVDDWTLIDVTDTETADDLVAPDRTQTMTTLIPSTTSGQHGWTKSITLSASPHVVSAWGYQVDSRWLRLEDSTVANCYAVFDLSDGSVYETGAGCTSAVSPEDFECDGDNKCYRCEIRFTGTAAAHTIEARLQGGTTTPSDTFAGDGASKYIGVWGVQVEQSDKATSVIKTIGASATRLKDVLEYAGNGNLGGANSKQIKVDATIHPADYDALTNKSAWAAVDSTDAANNYYKSEIESDDAMHTLTKSIRGNDGLANSGVDVTDNDNHKTSSTVRDDSLTIKVDNIAGSTDTDVAAPDGLDVFYVGCNEIESEQPAMYISNIATSSSGRNPTVTIQSTETGTTTLTFRGSSGFSFDVDWGDGNSDTVSLLGTTINVNVSHDYLGATGTKDIIMSGDALTKINRIVAAANTDYTGSLDDLQYMTRLDYINVRTTSFNYTFKNVFESLTKLTTVFAYETNIGWETTNLNAVLTSLSMYDCSWSASEVDQCIIDFDNGGGTGGTLNIAGNNAIRTTASDTALGNLIGKGWTVTVNE